MLGSWVPGTATWVPVRISVRVPGFLYQHPVNPVSWEPMEKKLTVDMEEELQRRLKTLAAREGKTVKEIVNGLVEAYLRKKDAEGEP